MSQIWIPPIQIYQMTTRLAVRSFSVVLKKRSTIKILKGEGANRIFAVATHALLLQNARYRILNAGADDIIGTDSIDNEVSKVSLSKAIVDYLK